MVLHDNRFFLNASQARGNIGGHRITASRQEVKGVVPLRVGSGLSLRGCGLGADHDIGKRMRSL